MAEPASTLRFPLALRTAAAAAVGSLVALAAPTAAGAYAIPLTEVYTHAWNDVTLIRHITPDDAWIVFDGNLTSTDNGRVHLNAIPATGGAAVQLSPAAVHGVLDSKLAAGGRVVFLARYSDPNPTAHRELWSSPVDGSSAPVELSPNVSPAVLESWTLGNPSNVLFVQRPGSDLVRRLYIAPVDGSSAARELAAAALSGFELGGMSLDTLAGRVYFMSQVCDGTCGFVNTGLWSVEASGDTAPVRLDGGQTPNGGEVTGYLASSYFNLPAGVESWVVYRADQEADEVFALFSAPADGSSPAVKLTGVHPAGGDVEPLFRLTPNGRQVVFTGDLESNGNEEIYIAPVDGSVQASLVTPGTGVVGRDVEVFHVSPVDNRIVYLGNRQGERELYSIRTNGSSPTRLNPAVASGGDVSQFELVDGGARVIFSADVAGNGIYSLYSVAVGGGAVTELSQGDLAVGLCPGVCHGWRMSGDGSRVLYNANDSVGYRTFSAPSDGVGTIEVLGAAADFTGGKTKVSGAFVFQHRNDGVYRMSADLSLPPVKMHDPLPGYGTVAGGSVVPFSDGSRVAFISDMDVDEIFDLWVADDDRQELAFDATGVTVGEGAGTIQVTVRLTQTAARDISFTWSLSGTATDGVDYDVVTGTPAIVPEGSLETTIELAILDDGVDEPDETLILSLDSVGTTIGTPGSFTVTIEDDDVGGVDPLIFADGFESGDTAEWNP